MSCFLVPITQAIATSAYRKARGGAIEKSGSVLLHNIPALEKMLWGGTVVLLVDHLIHGELFTFSLKELLTVGLPMSVVLTAVWAGWAYLKERKRKLSAI